MPYLDDKVCRLCMGNKCLIQLNNRLELLNKIVFCINIQIDCKDSSPCYICKKCAKCINKFYKFKQVCIDTENKLQEFCSNSILDLDEHLDDDNKDLINIVPVVDIHTNENSILEPNGDLDFNINLKEISCGTIYNSSASEHLSFDQNVTAKKDIDATVNSNSSDIEKQNLRQCKYCFKKFTRAETCVIHMRSHTGERPYLCTICGSRTMKLQDLKRHMKIHSDERKYKCPNCSKSFKRSSDLVSHVRTHTGSRNFKCQLCDKDYTSHSGLAKHKTKIHGR